MTFTKIKKEWDTKFSALANKTDEQCRKRLAELVKRLRFIAAVVELFEICEWLVKNTGGCDVEFTNA